jgi:hypothetical protein
MYTRILTVGRAKLIDHHLRQVLAFAQCPLLLTVILFFLHKQGRHGLGTNKTGENNLPIQAFQVQCGAATQQRRPHPMCAPPISALDSVKTISIPVPR